VFARDRHIPIGSLLDTNPLNRLVSEIFSIKVADKQTYIHTHHKSDNKGRLKLAAREPVILRNAKELMDCCSVEGHRQ